MKILISAVSSSNIYLFVKENNLLLLKVIDNNTGKSIELSTIIDKNEMIEKAWYSFEDTAKVSGEGDFFFGDGSPKNLKYYFDNRNVFFKSIIQTYWNGNDFSYFGKKFYNKDEYSSFLQASQGSFANTHVYHSLEEYNNAFSEYERKEKAGYWK